MCFPGGVLSLLGVSLNPVSNWTLQVDQKFLFMRRPKMRRTLFRPLLIVAALVTCFSTSALAEDRCHFEPWECQELRADKKEIRADKREIRTDKREIRQDRRELRSDVREYREDRREGASQQELRADRREIRADRRELRGDHRELRQDRRDLRGDVRDFRRDRRDARRN